MTAVARRAALRLGLAALLMFFFGFALAPFYGLLCRVAGLQSTQAAEAPPPRDTSGIDRFVTLRFDGNVQSDLPWEFTPAQRTMRVRVGQFQEMHYKVRNLTGRTITAQAVSNVLPFDAAPYFSKTECFCFREQTLLGGEGKELPLRFVVSPDLPADTNSLTVSYAFMALR